MDNTDTSSINNLSNDGISRFRRLFASKRMEKAPLISQRRLFRSLSGRNGQGEENNDEQTASDPLRTLGTFGGVFAPVCLSQFSTLLFLRVGFIVGNLGLFLSLGTLTLVYVILLFTILSICAISTNGAIEGGGPYYMISRTLGPEFGGAIGALFFLANVFSSALYTTGCVEGIIQNFGLQADKFAIYKFLPEGVWYNFGYGSALNILNVLVCLIGAGMFAKTTVVTLMVVLVCTASVFISYLAIQGPIQVPIPSTNEHYANFTGEYTGLSSVTLNGNLYPDYINDYTTGNLVDFATVFSVLFTGVTGIMAGANMSGELKRPSKNIPSGTLLSCVFTYCIYSFLFLLTALTCSRFLLHNNYSFMAGINIWSPFVAVGVLTATLSASLSNIIGASRVLAALVKDNIYGPATRWIGFISFRSNPLGAVLLSGLMVECVLIFGELNTIALFTSVFFLLSYLATNIACLCLEWASAPNFRPTFPYFSWWTATLGIVANGVMMFVISSTYSAICIIFCLILIIILHLRSPSDHKWGSISQALIFHQVRKYLLLLDARKDHVKFWRPQMLLLVANPRSACPLIDFVNDLKKSGLYVLGHVQVEKYTGEAPDPASLDYPKWQCLVDHLKVKAFIEVTVADSVRSGMQQLVRIAGLGAMKPNTVVLGFWDDTPPQDFFKRTSSTFCVVDDVEGNIRGRASSSTASFLLDWQNEINGVPRLESDQYVSMIKDILNMGKNVCLGRHFHLLDKEAILRKGPGGLPFIDVWPMNFFAPDEANVFDTSSLFLMQLATVLNMVSTWRKRTRLRVFLCVSVATADPERQKNQVWRMLRELRIEADIVIVQWSQVASLLKNGGVTSARSDGTSTFDCLQTTQAENSAFALPSEEYLLAINQVVRENSINTAVSFLYLPFPPIESSLYGSYLQSLTLLTQHLHPTLLVHGVSAVTTTHL